VIYFIHYAGSPMPGGRSVRLSEIFAKKVESHRDYAPDGLYEDVEGNLVAFELELA